MQMVAVPCEQSSEIPILRDLQENVKYWKMLNYRYLKGASLSP